MFWGKVGKSDKLVLCSPLNEVYTDVLLNKQWCRVKTSNVHKGNSVKE
jgi:hypothetical protein